MPRPFRPSIGFACLTLATFAAAQSSADPATARPVSLFQTVRPQASIVVTKHPLGADLVEVTLVRGDYPLSDLKAACERVGELTGYPPRGLSVTTTNPSSPNAFPKATFATNGLIVDEEPQLRLAPLIRAFGFTRTPLRSLAIIYGDYTPNSKTVRRYADEAGTLRLEAQRLPGGVEYRTVIDPSLKEEGVVLPGPKGSAASVPARKITPAAGDLTLPIVLGIGALAAGGLVYSLLLRPRSGAGRRPNGR